MVLIVSTADDPHCDIVIRELDALGTPWCRFNTELFPERAHLEIEVRRNQFTATIQLPDKIINVADIRSVWYRRPEPPVISPVVTEPDARNVAQAETQSLLRQLWAAMHDKFWMSWPLNLRRSDQKLLQFRLASELGFALPETIITQDAETVRRFAAEVGTDLAVKTISGIVIEKPVIRAVYTRKLSSAQLADLSSLALCPALFQNYVAKKSEIRVTVVHDTVFATEMETQVEEKSAIDWRRGSPLRVPHKAHQLPPEIERSCLALVQRLGLSFGAIDLIRTPTDEYVFLEINGNGNWAWCEGLTGAPIAKKIAQVLTNPASVESQIGKQDTGLHSRDSWGCARGESGQVYPAFRL
jgi:glutathione synthase/RimK-type ligase-like ATP-grasp enzyme